MNAHGATISAGLAVSERVRASARVRPFVQRSNVTSSRIPLARPCASSRSGRLPARKCRASEHRRPRGNDAALPFFCTRAERRDSSPRRILFRNVERQQVGRFPMPLSCFSSLFRNVRAVNRTLAPESGTEPIMGTLSAVALSILLFWLPLFVAYKLL